MTDQLGGQPDNSPPALDSRYDATDSESKYNTSSFRKMSEENTERDESGDGSVEGLAGSTPADAQAIISHDNNDETAQEEHPVTEGEVGRTDREEEKQNEGAGRNDSDDDEGEDEGEDEDDDDDEDEDDEEPRLKYARLTQSLNGVYRNGDATSSFLVGGDKMVIGTHNGHIHVVQLPALQPLRVYRAHAASVTAISVSPFPPPLPSDPADTNLRPPTAQPKAGPRQPNSPMGSPRRPKEALQLPRTPSNDIFVATASMDGNVCVQSLLDVKDVHLRNFARPVQAVALSPEYKTDRSYLSGGLAGQLILTVGGGTGRSTSTTTGTAAAAASGWLGSMGIGNSGGKDIVLHAGEGTVSCIKWSLSGKYASWLNEYGIKFMRTNLQLDADHSEGAWRRIGHYDRPETEEWETMASVWKGRMEWVDEKSVMSDDTTGLDIDSARPPAALQKQTYERLLVGWGGTVWIIHVHPERKSDGKKGTDKPYGSPELANILHMDCIISGVSLYSQNTLLVLAFCPTEDDDGDSPSHPKALGHKKKLSTSSAGSEPSGGIRRKQNNQPPELRLVDLKSGVEVDSDGLGVSRFERLSSADYHLGVLPAHIAATSAASKGALEALAGLGTDMWNAAINPKSLFSSGASVMSKDSGEDGASVSKHGSAPGTLRRGQARSGPQITIHPSLTKPGIKIFMHSPYDCILCTKRDLSDHLSWLVEQEQYQQAWELLDENPDILAAGDEPPATPSKRQAAVEDDESVADSTAAQPPISVAEKEKRRIGELWIQELVNGGKWDAAGEVCGKVVATSEGWEKWIWKFAGAKKFDAIADQIPSQPSPTRLPNTVYEVILGHYLQVDKPRFRELLRRWSTDLFDVTTVVTALENQLKFRDVREESVEDGEMGRDWFIVMESLGRLYEAAGRHRDALKCYIKLHEPDSAFRLIRERHLAEAVADDIPGFIGLRVTPGRMAQMTQDDVIDATSEAITLLVDEAQHGLVRPEAVVEQLQAKTLYLYIYLYLRALWRGQGIRGHASENMDRLIMDSQSLVDRFADLAVQLFSKYDRPLLMEYLKTSTSYSFDKAVHECESFDYYDELVYLYSKTGQMKRALYLIIDRLKNPQKAIEFAKEQDDPDLWEDLLKYSMDKPNFIRALLEQIGTAINPITLVRRIPEGLEIQGLREGLTHMMKEHELQHSISSGVAKVLRSELGTAQSQLRAGQQRGIKFEVADPSTASQTDSDHNIEADKVGDGPDEKVVASMPQRGTCASCREPFTDYETDTLLGFACGHVFHVTHLLEMLHPGRRVDVDLGGDEEEGRRQLVGMKVMRARLIRDKVRAGCPICHGKET